VESEGDLESGGNNQNRIGHKKGKKKKKVREERGTSESIFTGRTLL